PRRPTAMTPIDGAPEPGQAAQSPAALAFEKLGPLVDPLRNCKLDRTDSSATIEVPPGVHALSPELDARNTPIALIEVEGDFLAHVKVDGTLLPGIDPPKYKGRTLNLTFQGAGLILWQDKSNYVRLERTASTKKGDPTLTSEVLLEIVKNDKIAG